jgi:hypothetical protein
MPVTLTVPTAKIKSRGRPSSRSATSLTVRTPVVVIQRDVQNDPARQTQLGCEEPSMLGQRVLGIILVPGQT